MSRAYTDDELQAWLDEGYTAQLRREEERMRQMPDELTTTEAAAELDIQSNSVKRLCQRGIIQAQKRGRDWFISRDEVERYKTERRKAGRPKRVTPPAPAARSDRDDPASNGDD
jgi:excisionase family DNA binding protein